MSATMTSSIEVGDEPPQLRLRTLPDNLRETLAASPKLSREQCGHIRHIHNLSRQLDGDWSLMGSQDPGQEWEDGYRYQLGMMAYGVGAAHYHRLPAMRSLFQPLLRRLIAKMQRREVWGYWYNTSMSGPRLDPDIKELRQPWADPVKRENIMYSGHLLLMVSLYTMLFHDGYYDQPGSIVLNWDTIFWGWGPERFTYTRETLLRTVLGEMERNGWMGACCEPNLVFIICNQFPIIATRYNDVVNGTNMVDDVLAKYKAAWAKKGMVSENGLFRWFYVVSKDMVRVTNEIGHSAWTMAFMPWNYDQVQSMYPSAGTGFLDRRGDRINIRSATQAEAIKDMAAAENADPDSPDLVQRALKAAEGKPPTVKPYLNPIFGWVADWLSEIAAPSDLQALLNHADRYLHPTWAHGGLYYPRNQSAWDAHGNYTYMEPFSGNAGIAYARLNVRHGQKAMWDRPWTPQQVAERPWIDGVELDHGVDVLRGRWDAVDEVMFATFRTWHGRQCALTPVVRNLPAGAYEVYVDGIWRRDAVVETRADAISVDLQIGHSETDLAVVLRKS